MKRASRFVFLAVSLLGLRICGAADRDAGEVATRRIAAIEKRVGGRLGVSALDCGTGGRVEHRAAERFRMCSTFKLPLAAAVLQRVEQGKEHLERTISYSSSDLLEHAPITREHVGEGGMTVEALCAAAIEYSDNTAANLLLATLGGPAGLTNYFGSLKDNVSRLDRKEPELNEGSPADERDTTSPAAMLADMQAFLLGEALTSASRGMLEDWLAHNTTGAALIRAGLPSGWRVGDKTGRGGDNSTNDIAILRPPGRAPILLCIYFTGSKVAPAEREVAIAETARIVVEAFR